jgi:hypothetical protein
MIAAKLAPINLLNTKDHPSSPEENS